MTKQKIVEEAARRLGDQSDEFVTEVKDAFDFLLADLALSECVADLRQVKGDAKLNANWQSYDAGDFCGLPSGTYPERIYSLKVHAWQGEGLRQVADWEYDAIRVTTGEGASGRPFAWRVWPNPRNLQVWPPADEAAAMDNVEVVYDKPVTLVGDGDELSEFRFSDMETLVYGLQSRGVGFKDEHGASDLQLALSYYERGKAQIYARNHKHREVRDIRAQGW